MHMLNLLGIPLNGLFRITWPVSKAIYSAAHITATCSYTSATIFGLMAASTFSLALIIFETVTVHFPLFVVVAPKSRGVMRSPLWGVWVRCGAVRGVDVASGGVGAPCHQSERVPETFETLPLERR